MKKIQKPISILLALMMVVGLFSIVPFTASADSVFSGEGTQQNPFLIGSATEWKAFAASVNTSNDFYGDKYYKLTNNIELTFDDAMTSKFVGDSTKPFRGHFDGGGHTLTYNYSGKANGAAPFRYVSGATIENLTVTGTISISSGGYNFAAGIAGYVTGNTTISKCTSNETLYVNSDGSGRFGGIAGSVASGVRLNISNCVFNGKMNGYVTMFCGGFVGYNLGNVNITDCLCTPASIGIGDRDFYAFVQDRSNGSHSLTRAYRTFELKAENYNLTELNQGVLVYTDAPDDTLTEKVTCTDNGTYYADGGAAVSAASTYYKEQSGAANISYAVKFNGNTLVKGTHYTETITNSSNAVVNNPVDTAGTYTLTVTGIGNYAGSLSHTFTVLDKTLTSYLDANGAVQSAEVIPVSDSSVSLSAGWYAVTENVTVDDRIKVSGDVHLILCDNATLTASNGIDVTGNNSLTVYAQSTGNSMGALIATGSGNHSGIGGHYSWPYSYAYGDITINGGMINAAGGDENCAGIGGSFGASETKTITINGGSITASGGYGIGAGFQPDSVGTIKLGWNSKDTQIRVNTSIVGYKGNVIYNNDFVLQGTTTEPASDELNTNDATYKKSTLVPAKKITVGSVANGAVVLPDSAASGSLFGVGETIVLTLIPNTGYVTETLTVAKTSDSSTNVTLTDENTFIMPDYDVTVSASFILGSSHISVNNDGTVYIIHDTEGWDAFDNLLTGNDADFFAGKTVKLDHDISVTNMAGSLSHKFTGTFDGQGHSITLTLGTLQSPVGSGAALFSFCKDCVIQNLHVDGSIVCSNTYSAGFIGTLSGSVTLRNCRSSIIVTGTKTGSSYHSGFVAVVNTSSELTVEGCIFDGKLLTTTSTRCCSGFVGSNRGTVVIADSLYFPASINTGETEIDPQNSFTFVRSQTSATENITNCYYTRILGTAQGKAAHTVTAGQDVTVALDGEATVYSVRGITAYGAGIAYGGNIYAGEGDEAALTLGYTGTPETGYAHIGYTANAGTLNGTKNPYTLTMPDEDVTVNAELGFTDGIGVRLAGHSISLDGDIGVNFYMSLSDEIAASQTAFMQFTIPNGAKTETKTVLVSQAEQKDGYYVFKCNVAAKEMDSVIKAQIIDGDAHGTEYTYSVREYADYLLAHTNDNEDYAKAAPLVRAMLNYGAYAKEYFDKTNTLDDLDDAEIAAPETMFDLPEDVTFEGATLSLKSETTLSLYFTEKNNATLTFTCDDKTVETAKSGNYQIARIRGIAAAELQDSFTLKINGIDAVTYSPMNYCCNALDGGTTNRRLQNTVKALYAYSEAAIDYFGKEGE